MHILVDHSGHEPLDLGDLAMLQVCITRLRRLWPDTAVALVRHAPERLPAYRQGTRSLGPTRAHRPGHTRASKGTGWKLEHLDRVTGPLLPSVAPTRSALRRAVRSADIVVAGGGGHLTDTWRVHGDGVLSVLDMAQRLGKPTAMFSQGLGPLTQRPGRPTAAHRGLGTLAQRVLCHQLAAVLPRLAVLGLSEGVLAPRILADLGVRDDVEGGTAGRPYVSVTGDDALALAYSGPSPAQGDAIGVSLRGCGSSGADGRVDETVRTCLRRAAVVHEAGLVPLPVSRHCDGCDLRTAVATRGAEPDGAAEPASEDVDSPTRLVRAVRRCRVVVTDSYHAAVFALANGVPAVCLTRSAYYDATFTGLAALFPSAVQVVSLADPACPSVLGDAITDLWAAGDDERAQAVASAEQQIRRAESTYARFREVVEERITPTRPAPHVPA